MYTPTPATKRPRPPSSNAKSRISRSSSQSASKASSRSSSTRPVHADAPPSTQPHQQREAARSSLSRVSASSGDIGEVSLTLDTPSINEETRSVEPKPTIGLGLPSSLILSHDSAPTGFAQPSPPPPYGRELPRADTIPSSTHVGSSPPGQPAGPSTLTGPSTTADASTQEGKGDAEERLRVRRATDAARAIGLDVDFAVSNSGGEEDSELEEDDEELRRRLRSVRRRLRQRDKELLMAAQVADQALRQHEQVLSQLSPSPKNRLPQLLNLLAVAPASSSQPSSRPTSRSASRSSKNLSPPGSGFRHASTRSITSIASALSSGLSRRSPSDETYADDSPDRLRTIRIMNGQPEFHRRASRPRAFQTAIASPGQRYHQVQAEEAEQRIIALETALLEAQAGEENQRKAAARLRRDHEKLKRDLRRAEERLSESHLVSTTAWGVGNRRRAQEERLTEKNEYKDSLRGNQSTGGRDAGHNGRDEVEEEEEMEEVMNEEDENAWPDNEGPYNLSPDSHQHRRIPSSDQEQHSGIQSSYGKQLSIPTERRGSTHSQQATAGPSSLALHTRHDHTSSSTFVRTGLNLIRRTVSQDSAALAFVDSKKVRKPIPRSSFLSPPKRSQSHSTIAKPPLTPRLRVSSPLEPTTSSPDTQSRLFDSRSTRSSLSPARSLVSIAASLAQSPGFMSLSNRMASMREFVADSLSLGPVSREYRTLGSELGSEFGEDWGSPVRHGSLFMDNDSPTRYIGVNSLLIPTATEQPSQDVAAVDGGDESDEAAWVDEPDTFSAGDHDFDDNDTTVFTSPAPLPPLVSAALSSLALALAPTEDWEESSACSGDDGAGPILPRGCLRSEQVDARAYELLGEALKGRRIAWADGDEEGDSAATYSQLQVKVRRRGHRRRQSSPSPMSSNKRNVSLTRRLPKGFTPRSTVNNRSSIQDRDGRYSMASEEGASVIGTRGKGKATDTSDRYLGVLTRPRLERSSSSQSGIALAHRRVGSLSVPPISTGRRGDTDMDGGSSFALPIRAGVTDEQTEEELTTIPGKIIHDLLVWLVVFLQWVEWAVIIGIRVRMEVKHGKNGILGDRTRRWANRPRYYV